MVRLCRIVQAAARQIGHETAALLSRIMAKIDILRPNRGRLSILFAHRLFLRYSLSRNGEGRP